MVKPELTSPHSALRWRYICDAVGEQRAMQALREMASSGHRLYPLNAARLLRVALPRQGLLESIYGPPARPMTREEGLAEVRALLARLKSGK